MTKTELNMKRICAIAAAMLLTITAFAQDGKSIYNKYSDLKGVTAVYVSPAMFRLMGKIPDINLGDGDLNLSPIITSCMSILTAKFIKKRRPIFFWTKFSW